MIRLTLLLTSAIFLTFVIGGRDHGQVRAGLVPREAQPAAMLATIVPPAFVEQAPALITEEPRAMQVRAERLPAATPAVLETAVMEPAVMDTAEMMPVVHVTADAVNVREGPSVRDAVIGRLTRGDSALVVWADDTGWSRVRIEGDGIEGYVATRLLTTAAAY